MSFVQKNDNITIKVDESPDGNTTTFAFQDNTGKSLGGITMIHMNDEGKAVITVARINENNDLEILTVKELNPSVSEVETLVKELPWPQLPDDLFPILDENNTEVHGSVSVETSDGRIYTEGISGERETPSDSTDPQDEDVEDYECVEEDCEMDVDEFYNVSGYIAEIMYDASHYFNSWGVDWYEVRNEKGE
jgi:hypothetical protein